MLAQAPSLAQQNSLSRNLAYFGPVVLPASLGEKFIAIVEIRGGETTFSHRWPLAPVVTPLAPNFSSFCSLQKFQVISEGGNSALRAVACC